MWKTSAIDAKISSWRQKRFAIVFKSRAFILWNNSELGNYIFPHWLRMILTHLHLHAFNLQWSHGMQYSVLQLPKCFVNFKMCCWCILIYFYHVKKDQHNTVLPIAISCSVFLDCCCLLNWITFCCCDNMFAKNNFINARCQLG